MTFIAFSFVKMTGHLVTHPQNNWPVDLRVCLEQETLCRLENANGRRHIGGT